MVGSILFSSFPLTSRPFAFYPVLAVSHSHWVGNLPKWSILLPAFTERWSRAVLKTFPLSQKPPLLQIAACRTLFMPLKSNARNKPTTTNQETKQPTNKRTNEPTNQQTNVSGGVLGCPEGVRWCKVYLGGVLINFHDSLSLEQ